MSLTLASPSISSSGGRRCSPCFRSAFARRAKAARSCPARRKAHRRGRASCGSLASIRWSPHRLRHRLARDHAGLGAARYYHRGRGRGDNCHQPCPPEIGERPAARAEAGDPQLLDDDAEALGERLPAVQRRLENAAGKAREIRAEPDRLGDVEPVLQAARCDHRGRGARRSDIGNRVRCRNAPVPERRSDRLGALRRSARSASTAAQLVPPAPATSMIRMPASHSRCANAPEMPAPTSLTITGTDEPRCSASSLPRARASRGRLRAAPPPAAD